MAPEHEFEMMRMLGEISVGVAETKAAVEALSGPTGRVTVVEQSIKTANNRQWIHSAIVLPFVTVAHLAFKHFGL